MHAMMEGPDLSLEEFMDEVIEESDKEEVDALLRNEFSDVVHEFGFVNVLAACVAMLVAAWQGELKDEDEQIH